LRRARRRQNARLRWFIPVQWCENIRAGLRPYGGQFPLAKAQWTSLSAYLAGAMVFSLAVVGLYCLRQLPMNSSRDLSFKAILQ
jgi:hypothetical protein